MIVLHPHGDQVRMNLNLDLSVSDLVEFCEAVEPVLGGTDEWEKLKSFVSSSENPSDVFEHVWAVIDFWRSANEAPGGCSPHDAISGMREHIMALSDMTGYGERGRG